MTSIDLLKRLNDLGVRLDVVDGRLRVAGPAEVLTDHLDAELATHARELAAILTQQPGPRSRPALAEPAVDPGQQGARTVDCVPVRTPPGLLASSDALGAARPEHANVDGRVSLADQAGKCSRAQIDPGAARDSQRAIELAHEASHDDDGDPPRYQSTARSRALAVAYRESLIMELLDLGARLGWPELRSGTHPIIEAGESCWRHCADEQPALEPAATAARWALATRLASSGVGGRTVCRVCYGVSAPLPLSICKRCVIGLSRRRMVLAERMQSGRATAAWLAEQRDLARAWAIKVERIAGAGAERVYHTLLSQIAPAHQSTD